MTIDEIEARMAARVTATGLHVTSDDGQNVHVSELYPCPWCGPQDDERRRPYVQTGPKWGDGCIDARTVCPLCHVATCRSMALPTCDHGGRSVTRDMAIAKAVKRWDGGRHA